MLLITGDKLRNGRSNATNQLHFFASIISVLNVLDQIKEDTSPQHVVYARTRKVIWNYDEKCVLEIAVQKTEDGASNFPCLLARNCMLLAVGICCQVAVVTSPSTGSNRVPRNVSIPAQHITVRNETLLLSDSRPLYFDLDDTQASYCT